MLLRQRAPISGPAIANDRISISCAEGMAPPCRRTNDRTSELMSFEKVPGSRSRSIMPSMSSGAPNRTPLVAKNSCSSSTYGAKRDSAASGSGRVAIPPLDGKPGESRWPAGSVIGTGFPCSPQLPRPARLCRLATENAPYPAAAPEVPGPFSSQRCSREQTIATISSVAWKANIRQLFARRCPTLP